MDRHPVELLIEKADQAINCEDFDTLMGIYSNDALLVIKPGMNAVGKAQIRKAFEAIAAHFQHSLVVEEGGMVVLESHDSALVLARTIVKACNLPSTERKATYVFKKDPNAGWLCAIDNSYGHDVLNV